MLSVGLLFLLTRAMIDTKPVNGKVIEPEQDVVSSVILGAQTGLVVLAMIVTRSSVITLQKREGLGTGNLYVGWFTLCKSKAFGRDLQADKHSGFIRAPNCLPPACQPTLHSTARRHFPAICAHFYHLDHFVRGSLLLCLLYVSFQLDAPGAQSAPFHGRFGG